MNTRHRGHQNPGDNCADGQWREMMPRAGKVSLSERASAANKKQRGSEFQKEAQALGRWREETLSRRGSDME